MDKTFINGGSFNKAIKELSAFDKISKDIKIDKHTAFGQIEFHTDNTTIFENNSYILLTDSRLDNNQNIADTFSENEILIKTYEEWGTKCPNYLSGDFAFLIFHKLSKEIFCARDHLGIKPLYYYFDNDTLIISSEIKAILSQEDLSFTINKQYLADTLSIIKSENDKTIYNEIKKMPPAYTLELKGNNIYLERYWELLPQKELTLPDDVIIMQFKKLVFDSVKKRINSKDNIGAELSGGIDSSVITSIASTKTNVTTFSHILPDEFVVKSFSFKDEREFINQVCDYSKIENKHFITSETSGVFDAINKHVSDFNHISQQNFSVFSDQLYLKANHEGISVLLSGFGGDEVITSKSGDYLGELATKGKWKELKTDLTQRRLTRSQYFNSLLRYFLKYKLSIVYQLITLYKPKKKWWKIKLNFLALNKEFAKKMKINKRYYKYYSQINSNSFQQRNIERITHSHVAQRLEYCNTSARKYGIEYRYPFLDKQLIEYYLSMPTRLKARNGIKRYAIREAMKGDLPESIRLRNDKNGATIPAVYFRLLKDQDKIDEMIQKINNNPLINKYIDTNKFNFWFQQSIKNGSLANPGSFYNYLKLILFIEDNPKYFE